jgi:hypothetical protein
VLIGSPQDEDNVRRMPLIQTIRRFSPSTATTSPGWS